MMNTDAFFECGAAPAKIDFQKDGQRVIVRSPELKDEATLTEASDKPAIHVLHPGQKCLHIKSQGRYEVLYWGATEEKSIPVVVYRSMKDGRQWVRHLSSMFDGRFSPID